MVIRILFQGFFCCWVYFLEQIHFGEILPKEFLRRFCLCISELSVILFLYKKNILTSVAYLAVTRPDASVNSTQFRILLFLFVVIVFSRVEFHGADAMRTARRPVRVFSCDESVLKRFFVLTLIDLIYGHV